MTLFDTLGQVLYLFIFCIPELSPQYVPHFSIRNSLLLHLTRAQFGPFTNLSSTFQKHVGALDGRHVRFIYSPVSLKLYSSLQMKCSMPLSSNTHTIPTSQFLWLLVNPTPPPHRYSNGRVPFFSTWLDVNIHHLGNPTKKNDWWCVSRFNTSL